jgi:serine/threonine protein kinase
LAGGRRNSGGFLKALDFSRALKDEDVPRAMLELAQSFEFERNVLRECADRRMDRVICPRDDGEVTVDSSVIGRVNYLIFDLADGDIRTTLAQIEKYEIAWRLRALHHVATGLCQLHGVGIAHQDLKPSNILTFGQLSKIADLGCVSVKDNPGPRDREKCAGDKAYAPPELLYGQVDPDFNVRRFGCDCYLLGSLVVFLFSGVGVTCGILSHMATDHQPRLKSSQREFWTGSYQEVLPYVQNSFGQTLSEFSSDISNSRLRSELVQAVRELCQPDPARRGHPQNRGVGNRYGLERYRTKFDLLATRASLGAYAEEK